MKLPALSIGSLTAPVPIIQGGMGVGISMSSLAGAVAKEGGIGVISAAQPGYLEPDFTKKPLEANLRALAYHIKRAKEISNGGIIGVNIMRAIRYYDEYVACCIENGADLIISGAGLPLSLPSLVAGTSVKAVPIISSLKAAQVLLGRWHKRNNLMCDAVIIEGPKAGGHLGFKLEQLQSPEFYDNYDGEIQAIIQYVKSFEPLYNKKIPVIFAGGVYDRSDIDHYMALGCDGVQMATRFVGTYECDADDAYKQAYIDAAKEDITLVSSPVGMPGRAISNAFIEARKTNKESIGKCYQCLEHCNPKEIPYCITGALARAAKGDRENSLLFCGSNAYRVDKLTSVHDIISELNA
jgi:NAD(P)H-dependent flavin oxidoreductase YrpB (nitropropane dioxygenase family)